MVPSLQTRCAALATTLHPNQPFPWKGCYHSSFAVATLRVQASDFDTISFTALSPEEESLHDDYIRGDEILQVANTEPVFLASPLVKVQSMDLNSIEWPIGDPADLSEEMFHLEQ